MGWVWDNKLRLGIVALVVIFGFALSFQLLGDDGGPPDVTGTQTSTQDGQGTLGTRAQPADDFPEESSSPSGQNEGNSEDGTISQTNTPPTGDSDATPSSSDATDEPSDTANQQTTDEQSENTGTGGSSGVSGSTGGGGSGSSDGGDDGRLSGGSDSGGSTDTGEDDSSSGGSDDGGSNVDDGQGENDSNDNTSGDDSETEQQTVQSLSPKIVDGNTASYSATETEPDVQRTLSMGVPDSIASNDTVLIERVNVSTTNSEGGSIEISRNDEYPGGSAPIRIGGAFTYLNISHESISDSEISNATIVYSVEKSAVDSRSGSPVVYRYHDGGWEPKTAERIGETDSRYVYRAQMSGLSWFGFLPSPREVLGAPQTPSAIDSVEPVDTIDSDGDGRLSNFNIRVNADTTGAKDADNPYFVVLINGDTIGRRSVASTADGEFDIPVRSTDLVLHNRGELSVVVELRHGDIQRSNVTPWDFYLEDRERISIDYEPTDSGTGGSNTPLATLIESDGAYRVYHDQVLSRSNWQQRANQQADVLGKFVREEVRAVFNPVKRAADATKSQIGTSTGSSTVGKLSTVKKGIKAALFLLRGIDPAASFVNAIDSQAVAIHVNDRYTKQDYQDIRETLEALETNSRNLEGAVQSGDDRRKRALLSERRRLLEQLNREIPEYTDSLHESIIQNSAGAEDLEAYRILREHLEALRVFTYQDYQVTLNALNEDSQPLAKQAAMPTHGWYGQTLAGLNGQTFIHDTIEMPDDYTVYRVSPGDNEGERINLRIRSSESSSLSAEILDYRPDDLTSASGEEFNSTENGQQYAIKSATGQYYVIVEGNDGTGYYRLESSASPVPNRYSEELSISGGDPVDISVVTRAGPDTQRPDLVLRSSPPREELQSGEIVFPTTESNVSLVWTAWDDKTTPAGIQYKYRTAEGGGFTEWSRWDNASSTGKIALNFTFDDGVHRVQLIARDASGRQTVRNIDVAVSQFTPSTVITTDNDRRENNVFVRILPERRVDNVTLQYRAENESNWQTWKTVDDTAGFGRLNFPERGTYELRARATTLAGVTGDWDQTTLEYYPPDTEAPSLTLKQAPPFRGTDQRVTGANEVTMAWETSDNRVADSELEYRFKLRSQESADDWSSWQSVSTDGEIQISRSPPTGTNTGILEVRDPSGNVERSEVTFSVDRTAPQIDFTAEDATLGARLSLDASEPLRAIDIEYKPADSEQGWRQLTKLPNVEAGSKTANVGIPTNGTFDIRARPIDYAGNRGSWQVDSFYSRYPERSYQTCNREINSTGISLSDGCSQDDDGDGPLPDTDDGDDGDGPLPDTGDYTAYEYVEIGWGVINAGLSELDGEAYLGFYRLTREGREIELKRIEYTVEKNQTVLELPPNLSADDELRLRIENGSSDRNQSENDTTVYLDSLRLYGANPEGPNIDTDPDVPIKKRGTTLIASTPKSDTGFIQEYAWDFDLDGTYEMAGKKINRTFSDSGPNPVTIRATDVFGASSRATRTISVNAPPDSKITGPTSTQTQTSVTLDARSSVDIDGQIEQYQWDTDGDGAYDSSGPTVPISYADDGNYTVQLQVIDNESASSTVSQTIHVRNRRPRASLSQSVRTPITGESITFDAGDSSDQDGTIQRTEWDIDDDGRFEKTGTSITESFARAGQQTVTLRVVDDDNATAQTARTFYVNAPPTARATVPETVLTNEQATLNANQSADPEGSIATVEWDLNDDRDYERTSEQINQTFADNGTYPIVLRVTDVRGASDTTNTTITVQNRPPRPNLTYNPDIPAVGEETVFDATGSIDPDGSVAAVRWDIGADGSIDDTSKTLSTSFDSGGNHTVRIEVVDNDGATNTTSKQVYVNYPPEPAFDVPSSVLTYQNVTFDAGNSTDPDGSITDYRWNLTGDDSIDATEQTTHRRYTDNGTVTVTLQVEDDLGETRSLNKTLTVRNRPPNVSVSGRPDLNQDSVLTVEPESAFTLDATNSSDRDGSVAQVSWDLDSDGEPEATDETISYTFADPGSKTVRAIVTDDDGATATTNYSIYVNAPPEPESDHPERILTYQNITFDATNSTDPDGQIVEYQWSTNQSSRTWTGPEPTAKFQDDGTYRLTLRVTDSNGTSRTTETTLTVQNRVPNASVSGRPDLNQDSVLTVEPNDEFTLDASASSDRDGSVTRVSWDLDNDGESEATGGTISHQYSQPGSKSVQTTITDDDGATSTANYSVYVNAPPQPVADLPSTVLTAESVTLDAKNTSDPDGEISQYAWSTNRSSRTWSGRTPTTQFQDDSTHRLTLRVTDNNGTSRTTEAILQVQNRPLNASLTYRPIVPDINESVTLVGSTDSDGKIVQYNWDLDNDGRFEKKCFSSSNSSGRGCSRGNDLVRPDGSSVSTSYSDAGKHTARLQIQDDDGATANATVSFYVNAPPIANLSFPQSVKTSETVTLDASNSTDRDGQIVAYDWSLNTQSPDQAVINRSFSDNRTVEVTVRITDNNGSTTSVSRNLTVKNRAQSGSIDGPATAKENELTTFTANVSDPDGSVEQYRWYRSLNRRLFVGNGSELKIRFRIPGTVNLTLVAIEDDGEKRVISKKISVTESNIDYQGSVQINNPPGTYVVGSETTIHGTTSPSVYVVALYARDKGDFELLAKIFVDGDTFEEDLDLSGPTFGGVRSDMLSSPGTYQLAVVDAGDPALAKDDSNRLERQQNTSAISEAAGSQWSLRVKDTSLTVDHVSIINGQVATEDAASGIAVNGSAPGQDGVAVRFYGPRGTFDRTYINVDSNGEFDSENVQVGGNAVNELAYNSNGYKDSTTRVAGLPDSGNGFTQLSQGNVVMSVFSTGRDGQAGDGDFPDPTQKESINPFGGADYTRFTERLNAQSNTQQQIIDMIASETTEDTGSDDLSQFFQFRYTDGRLSVDSVTGEAGEPFTVETNDTMTVSGVTNRQPDDNIITVEVIEGPSSSSFDIESTDNWGTNGQWSVEIPTEGAEPGNYTVEASVGGNSDIRSFQVTDQQPQEPTTDEPTTEESTTDEPTTEESTTEQSTTEEPTTEQSTTEEPTTEQSTTEEPTTEQSTTEQPTEQ